MSRKFFTPEQTAAIDKTRIPHHVAIIPDGNRRWAKSQAFQAKKGHKAGAGVLMEIVKAAKELGIKVVTFYLFSTENWTRPKEEVITLIWLLQETLREQCPEMRAHGVKLQTIGELSVFPEGVLNVVEETKNATAHCSDIEMVLALNYGARDEIRRAMLKMMDDLSNSHLEKEEITETLIAKYMDTARWKDPELLIRTSGEMRISNFLLWQLSYAEIYVTNVLWPDFSSDDLLDAVINFQKRERRLGGT